MTNRSKMQKAMLLLGVFVVFATFATDLMAQAPTIGNVFGGGRKANVQGKAHIVVNNSSDQGIGNVYGGNDIAGRVLDAKTNQTYVGPNAGSEPQRTTAATVDLKAGHITGSVFGGGNGDYGCEDFSTGYYATSDNPNEDEDTYVLGNKVAPWITSTTVNVEQVNGKTLTIGSLYAGGNKASVQLSGSNEGVAILNLTAGTVGNIYGGGRMAPIYGTGTINFTEDNTMEVEQNVYAGNDIANAIGAATAQDGRVIVKGNPTISGAVFGGGNGDYDYQGTDVYALPRTVNDVPIATLCQLPNTQPDDELNMGKPVVKSGYVQVDMGTDGTIASVYGGGNAADVNTTTAVNIIGGTVTEVYGGCNQSNVGSTSTVTMAGGNVTTIYGGNNISGTITGDITVTLTRGTIAENGMVFGGSNGAYGCNETVEGVVKYKSESDNPYPGKNLPVNGAAITVNVSGVDLANGTVYGGGNMAPTANTATVNLLSGNVGTVYGGGRMAPVANSAIVFDNDYSDTIGDVFGGNDIANTQDGIENSNTHVTVAGNPNITGAVYGGGNGEYKYDEETDLVYALPYANGNDPIAKLCGYERPSVTSTVVEVNMKDGYTNSIAAVYGGCKAADVKGTTSVTLTNGQVGTLYGGCNISGAVGSITDGVANGGTSVAINGGKVTVGVFGGSNGDYGCNDGLDYIDGSYSGMSIPTVAVASVNINSNSTTDVIANVYGGGNKAPTGTSNVTLTQGKAGNVYGGGRMAPVTTPGITFPETSTIEVENVFGGNDIANTEAGIAASNPVVNVKGDPKITGAVYGGGNGAYTYDFENDIVYEIGGSTPLATLCGAKAPAVTSAQVVINTGTTNTIAEVYGGCKAADVKTTTTVTLTSGTVGDLYGGCNISGAIGSVTDGVATGGTTVNVNGGQVTGSVFGGSNGAYACSTAGKYTGSIYSGMDIPTVAAAQVNVNSSSSELIANVYAGGNLAPVTGNGDVELVNGNIGNVYGGGRMATVGNGSVTFPTNSLATINNVYAGNDIANDTTAAATAEGSVIVQGNPTITGAVFGGGNGDYDYSKTGEGKVYKSGTTSYVEANQVADIWCDNLAKPNMKSGSVTVTANLVGDQTEFNTIAAVYGGGNAADIYETTTVTITSGKVADVYGGCNKSDITGKKNESNELIAGTGIATVNMNGGTVTNIYGGNNISGNIAGSTAVNLNAGNIAENGKVFGGSNGAYGCSADGKYTNYFDANANYVGLDIPTVAKTEVNARGTTMGGTVNVYAGGNLAPVSDQGVVNLLHGTMGNVFGGGRMAPVADGQIIFDPSCDAIINYVFAGNDIANTTGAYSTSAGYVHVQGTPTINNAVFGGGNGDYTYAQDMSTVTVDGQTLQMCGLGKPGMKSGKVEIETAGGTIAAVYGGGNAADIKENTLVTLKSGNVTEVYGSCNKSNNGGTSTVTMPSSSTATVGTIYGGNNISGNIAGAIAVNLQGGTVTDNVFGGSNGNYGCNFVDAEDNDKVKYALGTTYAGLPLPTNGGDIVVNMNGATLNGKVYGGGNMAPVSNDITLNVISGNADEIFGGGRMAPVNGSSSIVFNDNYTGTIRNVFAGNDIANTQAATTNATGEVTVKGNPNITGAVFGGGNGGYVYANDMSTVTVDGQSIPLCGLVKPAIKDGTVNVQAKEESSIAAVYGGGNAADVTNDSKVNITSGNVTVAYGGCNAADVGHNAEVLLNQSTAQVAIVGTIYGGNNVSGTIDTTLVTLTNGTVTGDVFGGSNGNYGCNNGTIYTEGDAVSTYDNVTIPVTKNTLVLVQGANVAGNVYGGGHMAPVGTPEQGTVGQDGCVAAAGSAEVRLISGTVDGSAFAGGRMAPVYGSSTVNFPDESIIRIGKVFAGNDVANTEGAANTAEGRIVVYGAPQIGQVFAGGNGEYDYTSYPNEVWTIGTADHPSVKIADLCGLTKPNVKSGEVTVQMNAVAGHAPGSIVDVYGGANAADVTNGTTVTMTSGKVTNLYGGNNITGTVDGKATVTLTGGDVTNVFGGGNGDYGCSSSGLYSSGKYAGWALPKVKETEVNVQLGDNEMGIEAPVNIYGGGNMAPVGDVGLGRTQVNLISGTVHGSAFAGGRMADVRGFATICTPEGSTIIIDNVYGGNDIAGAVVVTTGTRQTDDGEGNTVNATAIDGTTVLDYANAASYVKIEGSPTIANVYGGGNGDYEYHEGYVYPSGTTEFTSDKAIHGLCGASAPTQSSTFVDMNLAGGVVDRTFGGGNAANVAVATTHINGAADNNGAANHGTIAQSYAGGNAATVTGTAKLALIAEAGSATANVNTIFGGNNLAEMSIIPNLSLTSGKTDVVYGGGNQGAMTADVTVGDVRHLSTYVEINSEDIVITDAVYGGCRAAAVGKEVTLQDGSVTRLGGTMVKMTDGTVKDIFGGNDVADKAHYAHVEISGGTVNGNVYGGSNGMYDYSGNSIYPFNHTSGDPIATLGATATRAAVDSSDIQILGGTFKGNIYGGGLAGDGTYAHTNIDGAGVVLQGEVFGAGRGNVDAIGTCGEHLGNVQQSLLELKNVDKTHSTITTVYGGGHAGDAVNTELILYPTFQKHLTWLYGGAYAANITGTAYTHIAGAADVAAVDTVYGGNNFAGTVQKSDLNIEAGTYNTIFGAGNGAYKYKDKELLGKVISCWDTVPYNMQVEMNLGVAIPKSGITDAQRNQLLTQLKVQGNVYGGGNMGIVGKDLNGDGAVRDRAVTVDGNTTTYNEQGSIVTNIYSGVYNSHVFGGARGREAVDPTFGKWKWYGRRQLVFGYKQINMYDGQIEHSLYGGSEFIDDGYPWLYVDNSNAPSLDQSDFINTTATKMLPPTGVVNIMGGIVKKNMYGGGYLGNIYGSVYVNVGKKAVDSSYVWSRNYNVAGAPAYYDNFKPALDAEDIYLMASIYNGSDWGEAYSNAVFDTRGFYGGESQIFVDGRDYNTSASTTGSNLPALDINFSLIGAGTSTEGGDWDSKIIIRHYGASGCNNEGADLSKQLYSIQRAKLVLLDSCFFALTGEQDAFSAYASPDYTFNRIDTLTFRGTNTIEIEDPAKYIGEIRSEQKIKYFITYDETHGRKHADQYNTSELVAASKELASHAINCSENSDYCSRVATTGDNKLIIENGTYVSVRPYVSNTVDENVPYGPVLGYMFLMADNNGTESYVYARDKYKHKGGNDIEANITDGGFYGTCISENDFQGNEPGDPTEIQLRYENASRPANNYRIWKTGQIGGSRSRAISIVAHANVISAPGTGCDNYHIPAYNFGTQETPDNYNKFAVAHATLEMPPSASGNYYKITGMSIDADNGGQITLVQSACDFDRDYTTGTNGDRTIAGNSGWMDLAATSQHPSPIRNDELAHIKNDPNFTFGLAFRTHTNFGGTFPNGGTTEGDGYWKHSVLVGDANFAAIDGLMTDKVDLQAANGVIPTIDFNLTYSTEFNTTVIRQVVLTVMEYNSEGQEVGPIDVTLTLATVVDDFKDIDISLLAMYNEGQSNTYKRKIVLPASFKARTIYLTDIEWVPDLRNVPANATRGDAADPTGQYFKLTGKDATKNSIDLFGVSIDVTENVTDNIANTLGWYDIATNYRSFDVFSEATKGMTDPQACALFTASGETYATNPVTLDPNSPSPGVDRDTIGHRGSNASVWGVGKEVYIGKLDGRATAAIDATLHFNGNNIYRADDTCGYVKLHFRWSGAADDNGIFSVNIRIKSRIAGDTIYIASQKGELNRGGITLKEADPVNFNDLDYAKRPNKYVTTIIEAMRKYEDGDVLCVLDTFKINESQNITINGAEYNKLQIIRYSGSHDDAPGKDRAYRGPMFRIEGNGQFAAYDCWFNGSGNTRVKRAPNASPFSGESYPAVDGGAPAIANGNATNRLCDTLWANAPIFSVQEKGRLVLLRNCEVSNNFNGTQLTVAPTFWGTSSVIKDRYTYKTTVTDGNGNSTTSYNTVDVAHGAGYTVPNGSVPVSGPVPVVYYDARQAFYPGGAIGIYKNTDVTPTVILGNNVTIHDNLVIDHATSGTIYNRGAAVYNREGTVQIGNTKNGGDVVTITNNYSLPSSATERASSFVLVNKTVMWPWTETDAESHTINRFGTRSIPVFQLTDGKTVKTFTSRYGEQETMNIPTTANLSNVFLTRTKPGAGVDDKVLNDGLTNLITFNSELGAETRVGITKWFPGTNYIGDDAHRDDNKLVRDTIKFGQLTNTKYLYAQNNFANGLFFDDSLTSYVFYHKTVSPVLIYFQRCASFKPRQNVDARNTAGYSTRGDDLVKAEDPLGYEMNPDSKCSAMLDTLIYRVQGGFYPYTYTWQCAPVASYTESDGYYYGSSVDWGTADQDNSNVRTVRTTTTPYDNSISNMQIADPEHSGSMIEDLDSKDKRLASSADSCVTVSLVMRPTAASLDYVYRVVGNDLTGNCPVSQEVDVRVVRAEKASADAKYTNATDAKWLGETSIAVDNPGEAHNLAANIGMKKVSPNTEVDSTRARYLRLCEGVKLGVDVAPSWNDGYVVMEGHYLQQNDLLLVFNAEDKVVVDNENSARTLSDQFFCPGDELTLSTYKTLKEAVSGDENKATVTSEQTIVVDGLTFEGTGRVDGPCTITIQTGTEVNKTITLSDNKSTVMITSNGDKREVQVWNHKTTSDFMMWDFDPQAPATNVNFVMPEHNYKIKAIYKPNQHWFEVVTNPTELFPVGTDNNGDPISEKPGYIVDYNGNVTITNRAGLAWLISTVNGLNYQQAQEFHNKTVTIAPEAADYDMDMSAYLWTPLGTQNNPFSGNFQGNNVSIKGIICMEDNLTYVGFFGNVGHDNPGSVIGQQATATINKLVLDKATIKGNNYVGGIAAMINNGTQVTNNKIENASMISGSYMVGGVAARVNGAVTIDQNSLSGVDFLGNAVCTGGIVAMDNESPNHIVERTVCGETQRFENGETYRVNGSTPTGTIEGPVTIVITAGGSDTEIEVDEDEQVTIETYDRNVTSENDVNDPTGETVTDGVVNTTVSGFSITVCSVIQVGSNFTNNNVWVSTEKMESSNKESGTVAETNQSGTGKGGFFSRLFGAKSAAPQIYIANNYVRFRSSGKSQVSGGLMGAASNSNMVNNYVYGSVASENNAGALVGYVGNNVDIDRCYYQDGTSPNGGFGGGKRVKSNLAITSFSGSGNRVRMASSVYGDVDNLTRALNNWALAQQRYAGGDTILSWRSDLLSENNGLPLFGNPDLIEVRDTTFNSICDSFYYDGAEYFASAVFKVRMIDTVKYIDSTMAFVYDVHYSQVNSVNDSVVSGEGYEGYGFSLTADEIEEMASKFDRHLFRTIELVDSTLSAYGCDSVIVLNLTVYPKVDIDEVEDEPETPAEVAFDVEVYPNPTLGGVTVESVGLESIEVYDAVSRLVIRKNGLEGDSARLDLSGFSTGVYYFRITTQHGVAIKKVIKK